MGKYSYKKNYFFILKFGIKVVCNEYNILRNKTKGDVNMMEITKNEMKELLVNDVDLQEIVSDLEINSEWLNRKQCLELSSFDAYNPKWIQIVESYTTIKRVFGVEYMTKEYIVWTDDMDECMRMVKDDIKYLAYLKFVR